MNLDQAIVLALKAHAGQTDKIGDPYIFHPLRLMLKMRDDAARIVAVLHDVVEDSPLTLADLEREGFSDDVIAAVDALTRRDHEEYADYVHRASLNPLARRIKIADLEDNMALRLRHGLAEHDNARMTRYQRAYRVLTGKTFEDPD